MQWALGWPSRLWYGPYAPPARWWGNAHPNNKSSYAAPKIWNARLQAKGFAIRYLSLRFGRTSVYCTSILRYPSPVKPPY